MSEALFDTSVLVDYLRGFQGALPLVQGVKDGAMNGYVSVITIAELFAGKDEESQVKRERLEELLSYFGKMEVNEEIAKTSGRFKRKHNIGISDAIIAATTASLGCRLLTQNIRDFARIKEITAEKPY